MVTKYFIWCSLLHFSAFLGDYLLEGVPNGSCTRPFNSNNCGKTPTYVFSYYKPGSRCNFRVWRGCPTPNRFNTEAACIFECIGGIASTGKIRNASHPKPRKIKKFLYHNKTNSGLKKVLLSLNDQDQEDDEIFEDFKPLYYSSLFLNPLTAYVSQSFHFVEHDHELSPSWIRFHCRPAEPGVTPVKTCRCGYRGTRRAIRITGGVETEVNEFPMMAALADRRIFAVQCGGVVISSRSVVSAAHCLYGRSVGNYAIVVGEHDLDSGEETSATQGFAIANWHLHPFYEPKTFDYDVAIIKVKGTIKFNDLVGPACLPFKYFENEFVGKYVTALGWGTTMVGGPVSNKLRKVQLQVISNDRCQSQLKQNLTHYHMCTYSRGKDACQVDSGGPLLYSDPATGLLFHVGIISAGQFCASTTPSLNTRVTEVLYWIITNAPYDYCCKL